MTFEQWERLQDIYGMRILDADYKNMSEDCGIKLLDALCDKFEEIYNDDEGESNDE